MNITERFAANFIHDIQQGAGFVTQSLSRLARAGSNEAARSEALADLVQDCSNLESLTAILIRFVETQGEFAEHQQKERH